MLLLMFYVPVNNIISHFRDVAFEYVGLLPSIEMNGISEALQKVEKYNNPVPPPDHYIPGQPYRPSKWF